MRWPLLMVLMLAGGMFPPAVIAVTDSEPISSTRALKVISDPAGGVRATATIVFPAPPPTVQSILTDYRKWPELFEVRMRVAGLEEHPGGVVTGSLYRAFRHAGRTTIVVRFTYSTGRRLGDGSERGRF